MTTLQLELDLWPAPVPGDDDYEPPHAFGIPALADHHHGHFRAPYEFADGTPEGTVLPAWVCCLCGGVECSAYTLESSHGCGTYRPSCPEPGDWWFQRFQLLEVPDGR